MVGDFNANTYTLMNKNVCGYLTLLSQFDIDHTTKYSSIQKQFSEKHTSRCPYYININQANIEILSALVGQNFQITDLAFQSFALFLETK